MGDAPDTHTPQTEVQSKSKLHLESDGVPRSEGYLWVLKDGVGTYGRMKKEERGGRF